MLLAVETELARRLRDALSEVGEDLERLSATYQDWLLEWQDSSEVDEVAGVLLRKWLAEHSSREPVVVANFCADDPVAQPDLIGIGVEADALAYLVASRDLVPPLAIGLFGDWGGGKSFLMGAVHRRVKGLEELVANAHQADSSVWKNIRQIRFNAWEYIQADLWAGLLERIFAELGDRLPKPSLVEARHKPIEAALAVQEATLATEQKKASHLEQLYVQRQNEFNEAERAAKEAAKRADEADEELERTSRATVNLALHDLRSEKEISELGDNAADLIDAFRDVRDELANARTLLGPYWRNWWHIALVTGAALAVPVVTLILQHLHVPALTAFAAGLAAAVPALTGWLRSFAEWTRKRTELVQEAEAKVRDRLRRPVDEANARLEQKRAERDRAVAALAAQENIVEEERQSQQKLTDQLDALTPARVFVEFADERSADYRQKLGLLATVRRDLMDLQDEVNRNNQRAAHPESDGKRADPGIPNRIVLYIDDLDRCPPAKVLQVLEAVHLLLAFSLFVVVVAVDSRWLSSALTKELDVLRPRRVAGTPVDQPTPKDYLEKIFQLPFWVQPVLPEDRMRLITGLLSGSLLQQGDDGDGSADIRLKVGPEESETLAAMLHSAGSRLRPEMSPLALSPEDLEFISSLGSLVGDTPRRIKRFVNTAQLLLAMRPALNNIGDPSQRQCACLLAAIGQGLPSLAQILLRPTAPKRRFPRRSTSHRSPSRNARFSPIGLRRIRSGELSPRPLWVRGPRWCNGSTSTGRTSALLRRFRSCARATRQGHVRRGAGAHLSRALATHGVRLGLRCLCRLVR